MKMACASYTAEALPPLKLRRAGAKGAEKTLKCSMAGTAQGGENEDRIRIKRKIKIKRKEEDLRGCGRHMLQRALEGLGFDVP